MALVQPVQNGQIVGESHTSSEREVNNDMGQDQFLQLLIAEMQNQDPLEPTSNTDWVAQMATFSMVESLNDMEDAMAQQSANDLVGKFVLLKVGGEDGDYSYVKGKVDYIMVSNGKTKLSVNDNLYDISTLDTVADEEYFKGSELANELHDMIKLLPEEQNFTLKDEGLVVSAKEAYDAMTQTQKTFVEQEDVEKLNALVTRLDSLKATQFVAMAKALPAGSEMANADKEQLESYAEKIKAAREYYDSLTPKQKSNVTDGIRMLLETAEKELAAAQKAQGTTADEQTSDAQVSAILQQILDAVKNKE